MLEKNDNLLQRIEFENLIKMGLAITITGVMLYGTSCGLTIAFTLVQKNIPVAVKRLMFLGLGTVIGGAVFTVGAAMEDDYQHMLKIAAMRKRQYDLMPGLCGNCKYFNPDNSLYCAVNPHFIFTEAAFNCSDYESENNK